MSQTHFMRISTPEPTFVLKLLGGKITAAKIVVQSENINPAIFLLNVALRSFVWIRNFLQKLAVIQLVNNLCPF
jgi:hypothetical protein